MALPKIVRIQYDSDFTLNCKLPNGYSGEDFIIRLYTTDKDDYYEASYLNGEYINCLTDSENKNIVIYVNSHDLQPGCLHVGMQIDYDNTHFADNVENIITAEETNVYLVKQNANATSAMYVGSALPDLTGSSDFITESDLEFELLNYYTKEDIDNAGYISSSDLNDFVTEEELNDMGFLSQSQLEAMGYTTKDYVDTKTSQKQDRLINGVNIKTINGNSLLGNGNINISGISQDDLDNAIAPLVSQEALVETLSYYATQSFVDDAIADAITDINVPTYTSDLTNDSGFITASDLNGYATETYVSDYVAQHAPTPDLSAYVSYDWLEAQSYVTEQALSTAGYMTQSDLAQAGYITQSDLSNMSYATTSDLNTAMGGINIPTYTSDLTNDSGFITSIPAEYVTESEISSMGYITSSALNGLATETYVTNAISGINIPTYTSDLTNDSGFITSIPAEFVTQSELSSMSYVTQSALNSASYATTSQLAGKQDTLVSGTNIKTVNNNSLLGSGNITISSSGNLIAEVTMVEYEAMQQAGTLDPNTIYVITDAPATDLSYYAELTYVDTYFVSKEQLNSASYITGAALSNMSYATTSQLSNKQDTLVSGTNIKTINNESLLGNGNITISGGSGEANVIESISVNGTTQTVTNKNVDITVPTNTNQLTNGAGFLTSAIFQYDSSTYTLSIII